MTTLSVPLTKDLEAFIDNAIALGIAPNKAELVRRAIAQYAEDQAVEAVLQGMREAKDGKALSGDIRELIKRIP